MSPFPSTVENHSGEPPRKRLKAQIQEYGSGKVVSGSATVGDLEGEGSDMEDQESSNPAPPAGETKDGEKEKKVSCLPCRDAKVKCIPSDYGKSCQRCIKFEKECIIQYHKRGRKPGKIKLQQILRRLEILDRTLAEIKTLNEDVQDQDAESLVKTLIWQLHRSKFFSKGFKADRAPAMSKSPSSALEGESSMDNLEGGEPSRSVSRTRATMTPPSWGQQRLNERSSPGNDPMSNENSRLSENRPSKIKNERLNFARDFNLLVDIEDYDSVSRVPEEIQTLSNPLKLLAQATDDTRDRDLYRNKSFKGDVGKDEITGSSDPYLEPDLLKSRSKEFGAKSDAKPTDRGVGWANTYFARGAFHPIYDNRQEFDPIDQGLLTVSKAERLIDSFYKNFHTFINIFDPNLSTITYIRKHSAFLLTVLCSVAADFETDPELQDESAQLAHDLRDHATQMMPALSCGDYKNVEMAQAYLLLASYQPMAESAMSDQTWTYLGNAIRIATELGCNLCCYSYSTPKGHRQEHYQRQLRNTERLWINLWIFEKTLSSQTGQRFHLGEDGVIATCARWHQQEYSLPQDEALVAFVELRRVMARHSDHFNTHILRSLTSRLPSRTDEARSGNSPHASALSSLEAQQIVLQLDFFRSSVHMDLKRWEEKWLSDLGTDVADPTPLQVTGALFLNYAALVTYSLPLPIRYPADVSNELEHLFRHCYGTSTGYMSVFVDRCQRGMMSNVTNGMVVSVAYCAVFALDLCCKSEMLPFIRPDHVESLARTVSRLLESIGNTPPSRAKRSVASKYSEFLSAVMQRRKGSGVRVQKTPTSNNLQDAFIASTAGINDPAKPTGITTATHTRGQSLVDDEIETCSQSRPPLQNVGGLSATDRPISSSPGSMLETLGRLSKTEVEPRPPTGQGSLIPLQKFSHSTDQTTLGVPARQSMPGSHLQSASQTSTNSAFPYPFDRTAHGLDGDASRQADPVDPMCAAPPYSQAGDDGALDRHWAWMMSDLDFSMLDGGDPILDQMRRWLG
ncbi:hypothetical protein IE53DRAFT_322957 [Violaceomyces palustris]|uniref:Uncharacterized protein n=1 Tax=Violaceomyces palustris TaxID=1673888 RepID=A0ACD0P8X2_9BASI|nr:hypothetical protein IE53DRAFT_322957 [Violaceomyces palustris]